MKDCLRAESLKMKRTMFWKSIAFIPLAVIAASLALVYVGMGIGGFSSLLVCNYSMPFASLSVVLLCHFISKGEKKHQDRTVCSLPIDLKKIFLAKAGLTAASLFLVTLVLMLVSLAAEGIRAQSLEAAGQSGFWLLGFSLLWISLLWQIPFCLFLEQKLGFVGNVILNLTASMLGGAFFSLTQVFWFFPYSWTARFMVLFFGILPSGMMVNEEAKGKFPVGEALPLTLLCLVLAAALTVFYSRWYARRAKR